VPAVWPGRIRSCDPDSELGQLLDAAAATDLLLEKDGVRFRLYRVDAPEPNPRASRKSRLAPERVLAIIGRGASAQGSGIAHSKDQYIADAAASRGR
jgi:hypothetical protein